MINFAKYDFVPLYELEIQRKDDKKRFTKGELVSLSFELGFIIALPILVFGFLGKWLDARAGTSPLLTLIGILTAIISTSAWLYRKFKSYF